MPPRSPSARRAAERFPAALPAARAGHLLRLPQRRRVPGPLLGRSRARRHAARKGGHPVVLRPVEKHTPQLVTWNGGGFDLPVLHYRGLRHGVGASKYWDMGEDDREFRLQQLHQPLPHAPPRPDGPAGDVPAARQCAARRAGAPVRISGQAGHGRLRLRRVSRGQHGRDPPLLRDRRHEHLPVVLPVPEDARRIQRSGVRTGDRAGARHAARLHEPHWREYLAAWPGGPAPAAAVPGQPAPEGAAPAAIPGTA